ncbi:hypothetical protein BU16DRAFT_50072 [Lophium mytilinum]|uniref:Uncharacterized protein n=1 Tax=Lophium mytilinum TaxID=390894 RepID=A0A6A6QRU3_9PEZI|nr:hypothetical protein BU16DRAFT_50072 [Lophium mytilinum]
MYEVSLIIHHAQQPYPPLLTALLVYKSSGSIQGFFFFLLHLPPRTPSKPNQPHSHPPPANSEPHYHIETFEHWVPTKMPPKKSTKRKGSTQTASSTTAPRTSTPATNAAMAEVASKPTTSTNQKAVTASAQHPYQTRSTGLVLMTAETGSNVAAAIEAGSRHQSELPFEGETTTNAVVRPTLRNARIAGLVRHLVGMLPFATAFPPANAKATRAITHIRDQLCQLTIGQVISGGVLAWVAYYLYYHLLDRDEVPLYLSDRSWQAEVLYSLARLRDDFHGGYHEPLIEEGPNGEVGRGR